MTQYSILTSIAGPIGLYSASFLTRIEGMQSFRKSVMTVISTALIGAIGQAAAAELPKQGTYEYTSCWGGTGNSIEFSKDHSGFSYEIVGTNRTNPPGGIFDMMSFRCVGFYRIIGENSSGTNLCEAVDKDGDRILAQNITEGPKQKNDAIMGTGKYEGIVRSGTTESLGFFPPPKPGSIQGCNHQAGTYKLK
jgi:hypothetical protein